MTDKIDSLKELLDAKFEALHGRLDGIDANLKLKNRRQDESLDRLADRTTSLSETRRLVDRVNRIEALMIKVSWAIAAAIIGGLIALALAYLKFVFGI